MTDKRFFIAAMSQESGGGIYLCRREDGKSIIDGFSHIKGVNYLILSQDKKRMYASGCNGDRSGFVAAFDISGTNNIPVLINTLPTGGYACCHLALSPDEERLYAANYQDGSVAGFTLNNDGSLNAPCEFDKHHGQGTNPVRQEGPHAHFTAFSPDGNFLLVNDLGLDNIFAYPYNKSEGINCRKAIISGITPPGSGPRHLLFESDNECILINEMGNSIQRLGFENGVFSFKAGASTLPESAEQSCCKAAAIRLSPDGKYILASNRGFDSIAVFERKSLQMISLTPSGGSSPRDFNFLSDGRTIAVTNEFSDQLLFFDFNTENGTLTREDGELKFPRPLCVVPL